MNDSTPPHESLRPGLLDPAPTAIASLATAVAALMGQNVLGTGVQLILGQPGGGQPSQYFLALGVGVLLAAGVAGLLARRSLQGLPTGWTAQVARGAVLVAAVTAVGAVLMIVGGMVHNTF